MSKGSNRISVRIPEALRDQMDAWLHNFNIDPNCQCAKSQSDFVLEAIAEKLAKLNRGKKRKGNINVYPAEPGFKREVIDSFTHPVWDRAELKARLANFAEEQGL